MSDQLLEEIDNALRADRMAALWRRYRRVVWLLAAAILLLAAADAARNYWREHQGRATLLALEDAKRLLKQGKTEEAAMGFAAVAEQQSGDTRAVAQIWQARAWVAEGKATQAAPLLQAVAKGDSVWADVACLRLASLNAALASSCLSAKQASPLAVTRQQWAIASRWQAGDVAGAKAALDALIADAATDANLKLQLARWRAAMGDS